MKKKSSLYKLIFPLQEIVFRNPEKKKYEQGTVMMHN